MPSINYKIKIKSRAQKNEQSPDGREFWSTGVYREIVPLERLVYTDSFADKKGNVVPASYYRMSSDFPSELEVRVTLGSSAEIKTS
jgi:uncharacterized protein YndB with AHSA1/START domain